MKVEVQGTAIAIGFESTNQLVHWCVIASILIQLKSKRKIFQLLSRPLLCTLVFRKYVYYSMK